MEVYKEGVAQRCAIENYTEIHGGITEIHRAYNGEKTSL